MVLLYVLGGLVGLALVALLTAELSLRAIGLGRPLLFERTPYGYRVRPSQRVRRFGKLSVYNEHGLRAGPLAEVAQGRVLCIGDSITNGGAGTDQSETWPALLEQALAADGLAVQVLNASAGGWALENEAGWLRAHGLFGARLLIVELGTHDLFQEIASGEIVGTHPSFPTAYPRFALTELMQRYPWYFGPLMRARPVPQGDPGTEVDLGRSLEQTTQRLATLREIVGIGRAAGAAVVLVLVEQPPALEPIDEVTQRAKSALHEFAREQRVPLVLTATAMAQGGGQALFRDDYHPNPAGNRVIAACVQPVARDLLL
jgi:lysophospholipase L1-like esterase